MSECNSYHEQLEMDTEKLKLWYSKENVWLLFVCKAYAEPFVNEQKCNLQYYHSHYHIIYATLARLEVRGKQVFLSFSMICC
jgi:hypothetical protein